MDNRSSNLWNNVDIKFVELLKCKVVQAATTPDLEQEEEVEPCPSIQGPQDTDQTEQSSQYVQQSDGSLNNLVNTLPSSQQRNREQHNQQLLNAKQQKSRYYHIHQQQSKQLQQKQQQHQQCRQNESENNLEKIVAEKDFQVVSPKCQSLFEKAKFLPSCNNNQSHNLTTTTKADRGPNKSNLTQYNIGIWN